MLSPLLPFTPGKNNLYPTLLGRVIYCCFSQAMIGPVRVAVTSWVIHQKADALDEARVLL